VRAAVAEGAEEVDVRPARHDGRGDDGHAAVGCDREGRRQDVRGAGAELASEPVAPARIAALG
jgi:hypothetical protein